MADATDCAGPRLVAKLEWADRMAQVLREQHEMRERLDGMGNRVQGLDHKVGGNVGYCGICTVLAAWELASSPGEEAT